MRKMILLAMLAAGLTVSACNTVAGAGRDIESAGEAVEETAQDAKN
ncbi:MAG: entericidin A/B family lipoprotein [Pseudomonadota bacterium]|jgi:predicted small secreted protein